ncbi:MAG: flavodoxin family protein [Candidatus Izimaplasma sp.]|nr:flavodoxin family protein [Candidatus Izimaplasma bacterium]
MAKVILINGSFRKQNTFKLLNRIKKMLKGHTISMLDLNQINIKPCTGCQKCLTTDECPIDDDVKDLYTKLLDADGLIIGSPVYMRDISGYLKVMFDRGCKYYHRPKLAGKPVFFVTTTQASGSKNTIRTMKDLALQWGSIYTGHISRTMFNIQNPIKQTKLNKFNYYLKRENKINYKPSLKSIIEFNTQKILAEIAIDIDYDYWKKTGLLKAPYYFKCKLNLFKRFYGYAFYKFLKRIIGKKKDDKL